MAQPTQLRRPPVASAPPASAVILHVDMDAFFVSVELLERPELRGKPVIVGGPAEARGVVAAASYEARRYGIHSAMALRRAARLCPEAVFLPPRMERYREYSERLAEIFERYAPVVEWASIDEAYLDLTGTRRLLGPPLAVAQRLAEEIAQQTRLPCSMGLASTRLVAKVASEQAKPQGLLWVPPGAEAAFLARLPVRRLPGVGPATEGALRQRGLLLIEQLQQADPEWLEREFGAWGAALYRKAWGEDGAECLLEGDPQSISHHHTFARDTTHRPQVRAVAHLLCQRAAARLRERGLYARTVALRLRTADFRTRTRSLTLPQASQLDTVLWERLARLLAEEWAGEPLRLIGVELGGLVRSGAQLPLFDRDRHAKLERLLQAADRLRHRYGFGAVLLGGGLGDRNRTKPSPPSGRSAGEKDSRS